MDRSSKWYVFDDVTPGGHMPPVIWWHHIAASTWISLRTFGGRQGIGTPATKKGSE